MNYLLVNVYWVPQWCNGMKNAAKRKSCTVQNIPQRRFGWGTLFVIVQIYNQFRRVFISSGRSGRKTWFILCKTMHVMYHFMLDACGHCVMKLDECHMDFVMSFGTTHTHVHKCTCITRKPHKSMIGMNALDYYMIMDQKMHSVVKCAKWTEQLFHFCEFLIYFDLNLMLLFWWPCIFRWKNG